MDKALSEFSRFHRFWWVPYNSGLLGKWDTWNTDNWINKIFQGVLYIFILFRLWTLSWLSKTGMDDWDDWRPVDLSETPGGISKQAQIDVQEEWQVPGKVHMVCRQTFLTSVGLCSHHKNCSCAWPQIWPKTQWVKIEKCKLRKKYLIFSLLF